MVQGGVDAHSGEALAGTLRAHLTERRNRLTYSPCRAASTGWAGRVRRPMACAASPSSPEGESHGGDGAAIARESRWCRRVEMIFERTKVLGLATREEPPALRTVQHIALRAVPTWHSWRIAANAPQACAGGERRRRCAGGAAGGVPEPEARLWRAAQAKISGKMAVLPQICLKKRLRRRLRRAPPARSPIFSS